MLGRLGLKLFLVGLFAVIILYHFFAKTWALSWVPMLCLGVMGVGLILWFVFSIEWIIGWLQKRSSQFGISVVISGISVIAILGMVNWGSIQLQSLYPKQLKFDLTRSDMHSLSDQTLKILKDLKEDVILEVWTFNIKEMATTHDMARLMDNYVQNSNGRLKLKVRNPNTDRLDAIQEKITRKDVIVAKAVTSGRQSRVENFSDAKAEEQITNAIVQAIKGRKKMLCMLTGHGELSGTSTAQGQSISEFKNALEASSYTVTEITLATERVAPNQCEAIASIGPVSSPTDGEIKLLGEYLAQGGKLLALWGFETPAVWQKVLDPYGVKLDSNLLIDERVQGAPAVYTKNFSVESELTRNFTQPLLFVLSRSLSISPTPPPGVSAKAIVTVEDNTLMKEGDVKTLKGGRVSRSSLSSAKGKAVAVEITQAAASTQKEEDPAKKAAPKETGILVLGNHMLAANGVSSQFGNMDFLLNSVSYMMKDSELIGIRPKDIKAAKLELTRDRINEVQGYLLLSTLAFLVFALMAGFGRKTSLT